MEINLAKPSRATWLYAAGLGGLLVAYLLAIHLPNRREMNRLRGELELKQQSTRLSTLVNDIALTQQKIETANAYVQQLRGQWSAAETGKLFGDISAIARHSGVRMRRFDPSSLIEHDELVQLPLAIECDGSFKQIFAMVRELEKLPQLIWIRTMDLQSGPSNEADLHFKVNLEVFADKSDISD